MKKLIPVTCLLLLCAFTSNAQFNDPFFQAMQQRERMERYEHLKESGANVSSWQRDYNGFCVPSVAVTFEDKIAYIDPVDLTTVHKFSTTRKLTATSSYGFYAGNFFPVAPMGESSVLVICVEAEGDILSFAPGEVNLLGGTNDHYNVTFSTMNFSLPVSVDMKFGGEAKLDRSQFTSFTAGFGMAPSLLASGAASGDFTGYQDLQNSYSKFSFHPFFKAEFGIFVGIFLKARLMYTLGKFTYFNYDGGDYAHDNGENISIKGNNYLTFGLSFTELSYDWKDVSWWKHKHHHHHH